MADIRATKTTDKLRMRNGPGTSYSTLLVLDSGEQIEYVPILPLSYNSYSWVPVYAQGKWGWCATAFLAALSSPSLFRTKGGLHVHSTNAPNDKILNMADRLDCVTVLNNEGLANALVGKVRLVVGRLCLTSHDPMPDITGQPEHDYKLGYDSYYHGWENYPLRDYVLKLDKRVIVQMVCEQNSSYDSFFYLGAMQAAKEDDRKLVIFNDSVGNPWDSDAKNGFGTWRKRIESGCLKKCKELGMYVGYHGYGRPDEYPGSSLDSEEDWKLYGGRVLEAYKITPEASRPGIIYTECGTNRANYMGIDFTIRDILGYILRFKDNPYVEGFSYWTAGGKGDSEFDRSCLDSALDAIYAALKG